MPATYDILIIGAGPSGLSCAIEAKKNGLSYIVIDKGGLTDAIRRFPTNMTFFSTPELLELDNVPFVSTNVRPTRIEAIEYYRKVVDYHKLNVMLHTEITKIRKDQNCFDLLTKSHRSFTATSVIVATGYFDNTNRLDVEGEDLPHVTHYYDEPYFYSTKEAAVIGGRNSAVETALDLYRHGVNVNLIHRGPNFRSIKYWVLPDIENRIKDGSINAFFNFLVTEIKPDSLTIKNRDNGEIKTLAADFVIALIGYRPDEHLLRDAGVQLDNETLIPVYDEKTFETNVKNLYIAGSVACGCKTWDIFIENGREHGKSIINHIKNGRLR